MFLFSWLNEQTDILTDNTIYTVLLCLHVADPATLSSFKQCSGTLFSSENSLSVHLWNKWVCIIIS